MSHISFKEIKKLALPAIIAGITEPVISLTDTAIIGNMNINATEAVGAVGMASSFFLLLVWGLAQIRTAVSSLISQYLGKGKLEEINTLIPQAFLISIVLGLITWGFTSAFVEEVFGTMYNSKASNPLVFSLAVDYYNIRAIGLPLALLSAGIFGVFRGFQNTLWAMKISIGAGIINVLLDIILVNGIPDFIPAYGVEGAAAASVIAQAYMVVAGLITLVKKTPFNLRLTFKAHPELKRMLGMTLNMLIRTTALNFAFFIAYRYANSYGKEVLAAYTIGVNIWLFSSYFIDGFSNAGNALSGKLLGEKNFIGLQDLGKRLIKINTLIATGLSLTYLFLYPFIGSVFSKDPEVIKVFKSFFWMVIISQPINAIAFTFDGIFKGLGETKFLRNTLLAATFLVFIPILISADIFDWKIYSIWTAFIFWMVTRAGTLLWKFRTKYSK